MPTLADARKQFPQYGDVPDSAFADALYQQFYSDIPRSQFDQQLGLASDKLAVPVSGPQGDIPAQDQSQPPPVQRFGDPAEVSAAIAAGKLKSGDQFLDSNGALRMVPGVGGAVSRIAGRAAETAKEGFGDRPLGLSDETQKELRDKGITLPPRLQMLIAAGDAALRSVPAAIGGVAGAVGQTAEELGTDPGMARRLERDVNALPMSIPPIAPTPRPFKVTAGGTKYRLLDEPKTPPVVEPPAAVNTIDKLATEAKAADEIAATAETPAAKIGGDVVETAARNSAEADRVAKAGPDRAGNVNLDRIHAPEDVKDAIRQTAEDNKDFTTARRGTISHDETRDMAALLGMSPEDLTKRKIGQAFNAEEMFAARELLVSQATKVRDLARRAQGGSDADRAQFAQR